MKVKAVCVADSGLRLETFLSMRKRESIALVLKRDFQLGCLSFDNVSKVLSFM